MPARRASSDRLQPRSAQATLTASADSTTTNPDRPTVTAAGPLTSLPSRGGRTLTPVESRAPASAWTPKPPRRLTDRVFNVPIRTREAGHVQDGDPSPRAIAGPYGSQRPGGGSDEGGRSGPEPAALAVGLNMVRQQGGDLSLPMLGRSNEQDLVRRSARAVGEVGRVRVELGPKATRLLGTAIPLEVDQHLAVGRDQAAPPVRDRSALVAFGVGVLNTVLANPVVEAVAWQLACREGNVDEELIGLELVDQMKATLECVLGSPEVLQWFLVKPLGQHGPIHLLWSWFGAGKTHTLFYFANRTAQMSKLRSRLHTVYSEFPKSARSFVDLYRSFAMGLDTDVLVDAYLEISTSPASGQLRKAMLNASPDLVNAVHVLVTGTDSDQVTAMRWLRGESLPVGEFRRIGVSQKIGSSEEASRIFSALVHLLALAARSREDGLSRVVWLLDEFQRIEKLPTRIRDEIGVGLHSTFNACPTGLSIIMSFSGRPEERRLPDWFSKELQDRIGRTKVLILPPMVTDQAMEFVRDILKHLRTLEGWDAAPYFPFTEATCLYIVNEIQRSEELKPRAIMHAFNAVLQEGEPLVESGELSEIGPDFAKRVLAEYVAPPALEEA
jgi:hypothetical protein